MVKLEKKKSMQNKKWYVIVLATTAGLIVGEIVSDAIVGSASAQKQTVEIIASFICLYAAINIAVNVVAIYKISGIAKLLPIICILVSLCIFLWSFFVASFIGYGS